MGSSHYQQATMSTLGSLRCRAQNTSSAQLSHSQIPFNNACHTPPTAIPGVQVGMSNGLIEVTREPTFHVKKTLPPTIAGFPGEAEISYFVKATIARQGLLKENPRAYAPFRFLPIEPPRAQGTGSQVYARQRHAFGPGITGKGKMRSLFGTDSKSNGMGDGPLISLDIRLPEPAIVTCNQILPLSIIVKKLNASAGLLSLQSLQVSLLGFTRVKAHELERIEQNSWVIMSRSNMNMQLGGSADPED